MGGHTIHSVAVFPVRWEETTGELYLTREMDVELDLVPNWLLNLRPEASPDVPTTAGVGSGLTPTVWLTEEYVEDIRGALTYIPNDDVSYDKWLEIGFALKSTCANVQAYELWVEWSPHRRCAHALGYDRVHGKARPCEDGLVPGTQEALHQHLEDLIGARSEKEAFHARSQMLRERSAQVEAAAIGVAVNADQRLAQGLQHALRGRVRALVRGELDRVLDAQLPLELLDRLTALVGLEVPDMRFRQLRDPHHVGSARG